MARLCKMDVHEDARTGVVEVTLELLAQGRKTWISMFTTIASPYPSRLSTEYHHKGYAVCEQQLEDSQGPCSCLQK